MSLLLRLSIFLFISMNLFVSCKKERKEVFFPDLHLPAVTNGNILMQIGHAQTDLSPRHRSLLFFKERVETERGGVITVEIYPNGILGDESQMTRAVSEGRLNAVRGGDLEFLPKSMLLGLPMIADTLEEARKLCFSDYVKSMLSEAKSKNLMVLAVGDDSGFRQITNSTHPIISPEDVRGLHIRVPQIPVTADYFEELGAFPTVLPFTELYAALATGKVAGQENPLALIDFSKFYEVQKYCTIIDYQFFPELMYVNFDWWKSIPVKYQKIIISASRAMMEENARITDAENEAYIRHLQKEGCQIVTLTKEQRNAFKPYAENVRKNYVEQGHATKESLKSMLAVVGKSIDW